ncbi:Hypothetical predicted protein [Paramuricea clavata]|uniref:Uncharacterized protein n=1 Tax=Paramuricea clavata TaxID=317549 RepID=A0A6S7IK74_PARCT|nr:Hypothetical predicted protein [Paramuricea clavata]
METNFAVEKDDLAKAKRDLLLRFIKDQEQLQTSQVGLKASNNDETFDILDGIAVSEDCSNNVGIEPNNATHKLNEHSKAGLDEWQNIPRSQTCIPKFRTIKEDSSLVELKEDKLHYRIKSGKKPLERTIPNERPSTEGSLRRLRSAPTFTGRQSRNILRSGDIEVKTRKVSSLSIVVPKEGDIDKLTRRRASLTCTQVSRPRATVGISAVDVELFDKHTVPSIAGPYTMFHLPPIASESAQTPPST